MTVDSVAGQVGTVTLLNRVHCLMALLHRNLVLRGRLARIKIRFRNGKVIVSILLQREIMCPFISRTSLANLNFGCAFRLRIASYFLGLWALDISQQSFALHRVCCHIGHLCLLYADLDQVVDRGFYILPPKSRRYTATGDFPAVSLAGIIGVIWCGCVTDEDKVFLRPRLLHYR
jgi:hypothetical protein